MAYHGKYESPAELLHDDSLSDDEKVKLLEQWRNDEKDQLRAAEEGMQNEHYPDVLKEVKKALNSLRKPVP